MVKHWNKLPRDEVSVLSLGIFKVRQDKALSDLKYLKMSLFIAVGLD